MRDKIQSRLTEEEIEYYNREGYVLPKTKVFSDEKFDSLVNLFEEKLAAWPKDARPEGMGWPHVLDSKFNEWALAPELVDLVEPLLGPDILLFATHFICKPKGDGRRVPWHEDSAYWSRNTLLKPLTVATVWLALDPSKKENGCMNVIPRSHETGKKGYSDYEGVDTSENVFPNEILPSQRKDELAVPCELEPNYCSLHDARTQHGSAPNTSNMRRCGWTLRFMPATVRLNPELEDDYLIYLARGRNVLNQKVADPSVSHPDIFERIQKRRNKVH